MNKMKKGFTLIELLIVIAVIAILATILITNFGTARSKAKYTSALESMQQVTRVASGCYSLEGTVSAVAAGTDVCSLSDQNAVWADPTDWGMEYGTAGTYQVVTDLASYHVRIQVSTDATKYIDCNKNGCAATGLGI